MVLQLFVTVINLFLCLHDDVSVSGGICQVFLTTGLDRGGKPHISAVVPKEKDLQIHTAQETEIFRK